MLLRAPILLAAVVLAPLASPASAPAAHWPQQGGDAGRSGYQPVGDGAAPARPLWSVGGDVAAAPLITGGALTDQRVVYGTADGRVHLRDLSTGAERGAAGGTPVDDTLTAGTFGDAAAGRVTFAESSGPGGLGALFVVHNADNQQPFFGGLDDVEVAVIDEATGSVVEDVPVSGTADHRVNGSAALSPPDASGTRSLLFLAQAPGGQASLVRVPVDGSARLGAAQSVGVAGADPRGGAAIVHLAGGVYAAVGTGDGVRTYSLARFPEEGPRGALPAGSYRTPSVPVAAGGLTPGQDGGPPAPALYVSGSDPGPGEPTRVHRLEPQGGALAVAATSPPLSGRGGVSVTVAQEVVAGRPAAGWLVAGTSAALHVLDARSLQPLASVPGLFAASVAAATGRLAFTAQDDGQPLVLDLGSGKPLAPRSFAPHELHAGSQRPAAQAAISRGIVVYATDRGVFAYRTRCGNAVAGTTGPDRLQAGIPGDAIAGFGGADALSGGEGDDCIDGGDGGDRLDGGSGADTLDGGAGRDILLGGADGDRLFGGPGADRVDGGPGDDAIDVRGGGADRARCGPGRDVLRADRRDRAVGGCERVIRPRRR